MASLLRLQALSLALASPRRLPSRILRSASPASSLGRLLSAAASPEQRASETALDAIELDQKIALVRELDGHVLRCVRDQNGNHVIQKCIECIPVKHIGFVVSAFQGQVATLSTHSYGCRVIQRILEHCGDYSEGIIDEIVQSACILAQDQYGNYVTQIILEKGKAHERSQIISRLAGQVVSMSKNKFASNVIEKCFQYGDAAERDLLIKEILEQTEGNDYLPVMMNDQFANYVIQKILETCNEQQRVALLSRMKCHVQAVRKYTYGKHIASRVEQFSGDGAAPVEENLNEHPQILDGESDGRLGSTLSVEKAENVESLQIV